MPKVYLVRHAHAGNKADWYGPDLARPLSERGRRQASGLVARLLLSAVAIAGGRFSALGDARDILPTAGPATRIIDLRGRRAIPGLIDSHIHLRGGHGGSVIVVAKAGVDSLVVLGHRKHWRARNGVPGSGSNRHGANGEGGSGRPFHNGCYLRSTVYPLQAL